MTRDGSAAGALATRCRETRGLAAKAGAWIADPGNIATVGRERDTLSRLCARAATRAGRLETAARRPMCVGVFGPSQAGKSYLIEVLARPETGPLRAHFTGHEPIDFLSGINPAGEKESTGLVTRFTGRQADGPEVEGFPVRIRALTELDVVKILGNTYFLDGDQTKEIPPSPEVLRRLADELGADRPDAAPHLDDAGLFDLEAYFSRHFAGARAADALSGYWDDVRRLAPRLARPDRARLFAPLWGGHEVFTEIYRQLTDALDGLGHPDEIFVGLEALVPREGSVLDVATLTGLGETIGSDALRVRTLPGHEATLPRHVVCAVAAELRIQLADPGRPFLRSADLLDFPGARSRQKVHLAEFLSAHPEAAKETFLRGKVAFLFDRYVAEQELTAMLLCVRPSNQEVATLPDLVDDWIGATHGRTPEARAAQPNLLFLVLTWFDSHFVEKAGDAGQDTGSRFRNRLEASLLGFFGKAHRWPREWRPGEAFRNTFWFRNPNYPAEAIIRYDGRREIEFLPEKTSRIRELRDSFAALPEAHAHFAEPARAFDEALRLNDGGVSYLVETLATVCRSELKLEQVSARLDELRADLREQLVRFYVPTDLGERLDAKRANANRVFDALEPVIAAERFGSLLRHFLIDVATLADALQGAALRSEKTEAAPPRPAAPAPSRILRPGQAASSGTAASVVQDATAADREHPVARQAVEAWIAHLRVVAGGEALSRAFALPRDAAALLVDELVELAARADMEARITSDLKILAAVERTEQASAKVALIAATRLNRLVGGLGFTTIPPVGEAPAVPDERGSHPAFASRPVPYDARSIGSEPKLIGQLYATDWFHGFYKVAEENAMRRGSGGTDMRQNERLRTVLDGLGGDTSLPAPHRPATAA